MFFSRFQAKRRRATVVPSLLFLAFALGLVLLAAPCGLPRAAAAGHRAGLQEKSWEFERLDVDIKVNRDASMSVKETTVVNFTGSFSYVTHLISTQGPSGAFNGKTYGKVRIKDLKVLDRDGNPLPRDGYTVKSTPGGELVTINFSAANEQKGWIFEYRRTNVIIFGESEDRLYYNAISSDRPVPVKESRVTVAMPEGTDMQQVKSTQYVPESQLNLVMAGREGDLLTWKVNMVPPSTAFTIDVAFPKGITSPPFRFRPAFLYIMIALDVLLLGAALAIMLLSWWKKGRDVSSPELDVVQYEPPKNLLPAMVGTLIHEKPLNSHITATIVDLAVRGKIVIFEVEKTGILGRKKHGFRRTDADVHDLKDYEVEVLSGLFETGPEVTEDDLKEEFYTHISTIDEGVKEEVRKLQLFDKDPENVKRVYMGLGVLIAIPVPVLIGLLTHWFDLGYFYVLLFGFLAAGIVVFVVGRYMPRRTVKGSIALSYVRGFQEYLSTAEHDELAFMTPENFQMNLPYAMVLGVTENWARKFADIYTSPPDWYQGTYAAGFSTVYLGESLLHMETHLTGTLSSSPSSSGGGGFGGGGDFGGGFSGGGFDGGGFGAG